ncbi:MAG: aldehyde dehydrogenase family protein [Bradymonadaceae bacterium]
MSSIDAKGNFIAGSWEETKSPDGEIERRNPADLSEVVFRTSWDAVAADRAVSRAREALPAWDRAGVEERREYVERLPEIFESRREELAETVAREVGKPLWEARREVDALSAKIDVMTDEGLEFTRERRPDQPSNGRWRYRPLGVLAVIGPYNFPLHLPHGHVVPALLNGNTVVIKPSELAGGSMQTYVECLREAGFPDGVVNLVQGPAEVGRVLTEHRDVNGVLFTGSWKTGRAIKRQTVDHYWKLLALEMGGKNTSIVLEDADLEQAAYQITRASFLTTGQRCSATSRVVVREEVAGEFVDRFEALADRVTTGDPVEETVFMGPLASEGALETFLEAQDPSGGAITPIRRGGRTRDDLNGYFVEPGIWLAEEVDATDEHQAREIFGPDVVVYPVDSDEAAVAAANATEYGLAMSVFTADDQRFEELAYDLRAGVLNLNESTAGASSRLPFGGVKKSGNHRPSAVLAGQYCTYPQAQLRESAGWDESEMAERPLDLLR